MTPTRHRDARPQQSTSVGLSTRPRAGRDNQPGLAGRDRGRKLPPTTHRGCRKRTVKCHGARSRCACSRSETRRTVLGRRPRSAPARSRKSPSRIAAVSDRPATTTPSRGRARAPRVRWPRRAPGTGHHRAPPEGRGLPQRGGHPDVTPVGIGLHLYANVVALHQSGTSDDARVAARCRHSGERGRRVHPHRRRRERKRTGPVLAPSRMPVRPPSRPAVRQSSPESVTIRSDPSQRRTSPARVADVWTRDGQRGPQRGVTAQRARAVPDGPSRTRTWASRVMSPVLYPTELTARGRQPSPHWPRWRDSCRRPGADRHRRRRQRTQPEGP